jgi:alkenylglycerophosphocholine/alkenylglycerophosphoethanolamine hydrolase
MPGSVQAAAHSATSRRTKLLIAVAVVAALLFILPFTSDMPWVRLVAKPIPVLCMALWMAWLPRKGRFQVAVLVGLLLGALGDLLLELGDQTFVFGLVAFLLGHLAYTYAFLQDCRQPRWGWAVASYLYGAVAFFVLLRAGDLGAMLVPVAVYVLVICTMLWRALSRLGAPGVPARSVQAGVVGALLFAASDSLLAFRLFVTPFPLSGLLVIGTYWLGQLGITLSAAWASSQEVVAETVTVPTPFDGEA